MPQRRGQPARVIAVHLLVALAGRQGLRHVGQIRRVTPWREGVGWQSRLREQVCANAGVSGAAARCLIFRPARDLEEWVGGERHDERALRG